MKKFCFDPILLSNNKNYRDAIMPVGKSAVLRNCSQKYLRTGSRVSIGSNSILLYPALKHNVSDKSARPSTENFENTSALQVITNTQKPSNSKCAIKVGKFPKEVLWNKNPPPRLLHFAISTSFALVLMVIDKVASYMERYLIYLVLW